MRRLRHVAIAGVVSLILTVTGLLPLATGDAAAHGLASCSGSYCIYEPYGHSGDHARGTGTLIDIPSTVTLYHTDELIAGSVWLIQDSSTAIETGVGIGADNVCGYNPYWTPYATINNGYPEQNNCAYYLSANSTWQVQSFVNNGIGFSFFNTQYGTPRWAVNWGSYNITGLNYDMTEIHGDGDHPYYDIQDFVNEEWWNGSSWSYWGYTDVVSDCPYRAVWVDNSYWYSYDEVNC
jgi:hypothetical protein